MPKHSEWREDTGPHGAKRWINTRTGRIQYRDPGTPHPAFVRAQAEQQKNGKQPEEGNRRSSSIVHPDSVTDMPKSKEKRRELTKHVQAKFAEIKMDAASELNLKKGETVPQDAKQQKLEGEVVHGMTSLITGMKGDFPDQTMMSGKEYADHYKDVLLKLDELKQSYKESAHKDKGEADETGNSQKSDDQSVRTPERSPRPKGRSVASDAASGGTDRSDKPADAGDKPVDRGSGQGRSDGAGGSVGNVPASTGTATPAGDLRPSKAEVVDSEKLDQLIRANKTPELFRGVPKMEHAEQFNHGDLREGDGAYGPGIYVGYGYNGRETAKNAAGDDGHMARMTLRPDAKVMAWDEAETTWEKEGKAEFSIDKYSGSEKAIAAFAKSRGVDVLDVQHNEFMNVLNQSALIVEKPKPKAEKKLAWNDVRNPQILNYLPPNG